MDLNKVGLSATSLLCFGFYRYRVYVLQSYFSCSMISLAELQPAMHVLTQTSNISNKKLSCLFLTAIQMQSATG